MRSRTYREGLATIVALAAFSAAGGAFAQDDGVRFGWTLIPAEVTGPVVQPGPVASYQVWASYDGGLAWTFVAIQDDPTTRIASVLPQADADQVIVRVRAYRQGGGLGPWSDPSDPYRFNVEDLDGDQVADDVDNCLGHPNAKQLDADRDGYGNACDADLDQNGIVGIADQTRFFRCFQFPDEPHCPAADFDESGTVLGDLVRNQQLFGKPPGPSALCDDPLGCPQP